jgi:hypothetical protein
MSFIDILKFVKYTDCYPNVSIAYGVFVRVSKFENVIKWIIVI